MSLVDGIMKIASKYKEELAGITRAKVLDHLEAGTYLVKGSTFLLWSYVKTKSYQGVPLLNSTIQLEYIASGVKGQGDAESLLNQLKVRGCDIVLMVREDNPRGIAFYEKHGFKKERVVEYKNYNSHIMVWRTKNV